VVSIERLRGSNSDEYNEEDEEIELEIVEVEELDEPVPTQDSCLQVNAIQQDVDSDVFKRGDLMDHSIFCIHSFCIINFDSSIENY
jgi:hypothetical protein